MNRGEALDNICFMAVSYGTFALSMIAFYEGARTGSPSLCLIGLCSTVLTIVVTIIGAIHKYGKKDQ